MTEYRVKWEIDLEGASPRDSAVKARDIQRDPGSSAVVFDVYPKQEDRAVHRVDLDEDEDFDSHQFFQYVLFESKMSGPQLYKLISRKPITMDEVGRWAENRFKTTRYSYGVTLLDPPESDVIA